MDNNILQDQSDDIKQQNQLRVEIDNLRLQNQVLRVQLKRHQDSRYSFNNATKIWWLEFNHSINNFWLEVRKRLGKIKRISLINKYNNKDDSTPEQSFEPYEVKILHPLQNNRPRIVHALGNFLTGGSSRLVVDLIEHLGHQFEQEIIVPYKPYLASYVGLEIYEYPDLTNPDKILAYLEQFKPDIVHVHYWGECDWDWYDNVFQAAQKYECKLVENVNTPVEPYVSESINCYVYVSDYVKHEFGRLDSRNITIYPGSNFQLFSHQNNLESSEDCIGMVYRLDRDKLNEHAIDVFIEVVKRRGKTKVLIVGGGYYFEAYQKAVQEAGLSDAFTFTGYVSYENLPSLYEQMSVFVAPVYKESFGQVSPFAMNMGIPVVGYDVGALKEIVGDRKLLAPPEDSTRLADIIIELLDDRETRQKIGAANCQRAQLMFSVETMIHSYRMLYEEMLQSNV